jgi:hypothetical protein
VLSFGIAALIFVSCWRQRWPQASRRQVFLILDLSQ